MPDPTLVSLHYVTADNGGALWGLGLLSSKPSPASLRSHRCQLLLSPQSPLVTSAVQTDAGGEEECSRNRSRSRSVAGAGVGQQPQLLIQSIAFSDQTFPFLSEWPPGKASSEEQKRLGDNLFYLTLVLIRNIMRLILQHFTTFFWWVSDSEFEGVVRRIHPWHPHPIFPFLLPSPHSQCSSVSVLSWSLNSPVGITSLSQRAILIFYLNTA